MPGLKLALYPSPLRVQDDNSYCRDDESPKNFLHLRALNFKPLKELIMRQYIIAGNWKMNKTVRRY